MLRPFSQFQEKTPYYYIALAMMLISMGIVYLMEKSRYGFYFVAIRENEDAARALGINTLKYKVLATAGSAFLTAFGGSFHAQYILYIDPAGAFGNPVSIDIILRTIIGGMGTVFGPVLGSFLISPLSELIQLLIGVGRSLWSLYDGLRSDFNGRLSLDAQWHSSLSEAIPKVMKRNGPCLMSSD